MNIKFDDSFNWLAVLKDLAAGMPITDQEHQKLITMAEGWPTCACGQLCKELPRWAETNVPHDITIRIWGSCFLCGVEAKDWQGATLIFHKIEARTTALLGLNEPSRQSTPNNSGGGVA